jgi:hypothetical protein
MSSVDRLRRFEEQHGATKATALNIKDGEVRRPYFSETGVGSFRRLNDLPPRLRSHKRDRGPPSGDLIADDAETPPLIADDNRHAEPKRSAV